MVAIVRDGKAEPTGGIHRKSSFSFQRQGKNSEEFLRRDLLGGIGNMIDKAVLQGTGAAGQPTGLLYAPGVSASSGVFSNVNAADMEEAVCQAGVDDEKLVFVTDPTIRERMRNTVEAAWSTRAVWHDGGMIDRPGFVTPNCPVDWIFLGDWSHATLVLWGAGLELRLDPYTDFQSGRLGICALVSCDVVFTKPAAFFRWQRTGA